MTYTKLTSTIRSIRQGDSGFYISDKYAIAGRAGLEISADCPSDIADTIRQAVNRKWLTMVANVKSSELVWETLSE